MNELDLNEQVVQASIKSIFSQLTHTLFFGQMASILVIAWFWSKSEFSQQLNIWAVIMLLALVLDVRLHKSFTLRKSDSLDVLCLWEHRLIYLSLLIASGWGLLFLIIQLNNARDAFTGVVIFSVLSINCALIFGLRIRLMLVCWIPIFIFGLYAYSSTTYLVWFLGSALIIIVTTYNFSTRNMRSLKAAIQLANEKNNLLAELRKQKEAAEKSNLAKTKFLAAASHDLRQPLQSVSLLSAALDFHIKGEKEKSILEKLQNSVDSLSELLNSLLDISKLDAEVIQPEIRPILLNELFQQSIEKFEPIAAEKGLVFGYQSTSDAWINSDPQLLSRIIGNLLENAIRYTKSGSVSVVLKKEHEMAVILLKDTGIGIRDEDKQNIFTEFYQADNPERDRQKGLGLGLSIVKRLSGLLGIQLEFESLSGLGTTFKLTCPLVENTPVSHLNMKKETEAPSEQLTVLVIDDEASVRESMKILFEAWSCLVLTAGDEIEALNVISKLDSPIDALFVDYRLREGKTGVQLANKLARYLNYDLPIMVITGDTAPDQLRDIEASGFQLAHKPIQPKVLKSFLKTSVVKRESAPVL